MLTLCATLAAAGAARAEMLEDGALLDALRHGGYVLVMRHAHSPGKPPEHGAAQAGNLTMERELDEAGRDSARSMGQAVRRLGIPIGEIESSPTYRALETVELSGLGGAKREPELGDGSESGADGDASRAGWLRRRVDRAPRAGTNTLLVTHAPNMAQAFGQEASDISDGETLVFRPDARGTATLIARIRIQDWSNLNRNAP